MIKKITWTDGHIIWLKKLRPKKIVRFLSQGLPNLRRRRQKFFYFFISKYGNEIAI